MNIHMIWINAQMIYLENVNDMCWVGRDHICVCCEVHLMCMSFGPRSWVKARRAGIGLGHSVCHSMNIFVKVYLDIIELCHGWSRLCYEIELVCHEREH